MRKIRGVGTFGVKQSPSQTLKSWGAQLKQFSKLHRRLEEAATPSNEDFGPDWKDRTTPPTLDVLYNKLVAIDSSIEEIDPASNGITNQSGWAPALTGTGSMTVTADDIQVAKFWDVGGLTVFRLRASFTTGGTASTSIIVPLPGGYSQPFDFVTSIGFGTVVDGGAGVDAQVLAHSATEFVVNRYDSANWSLGTNRRIIVSGFFERV